MHSSTGPFSGPPFYPSTPPHPSCCTATHSKITHNTKYATRFQLPDKNRFSFFKMWNIPHFPCWNGLCNMEDSNQLTPLQVCMLLVHLKIDMVSVKREISNQLRTKWIQCSLKRTGKISNGCERRCGAFLVNHLRDNDLIKIELEENCERHIIELFNDSIGKPGECACFVWDSQNVVT